MTIRIELLSYDRAHLLVAPPETTVYAHRFHDLPPPLAIETEIAQLYGGTVASSPVMSQPVIAPQTRPEVTPSPTSRWSTSLQTVLDRPSPTLPDRLVMGGVIFCAAFATWAMTSQMEEVGRAQGRLVPQGAPFKVHPVVAGKISQVYVHEGQVVKAGQPIADLDNEIALNRLEGLRQERASYEKELLQTGALIDKTQLEAQTRVAIAHAEIRAQEAAIAQAQAKIEGQDTTIHQAEERAVTSQAVLSQLQTDATAQKERLTRLKYLVDEGALAREQLFQAQQNFGDRQRGITQQMGEIRQTVADSNRSRSDLQQAIAESQGLRALLAQRYAEGQNAQVQSQQTIQQLLVQQTQLQAKLQQSEKQLQQAQTEIKQLVLKAPVDGVVLALNVRNRGEVVQSGQTIAEVASQTAPLMLAAALPTREAGFVKVGDPVQIKFDAYPYQDYGIVTGKVTTIAPDIRVDERLGAVYRVEIALDRPSSQTTRLKIGQTATAEIVIRRRAVVDMLLDPIRQLQKSGLSL